MPCLIEFQTEMFDLAAEPENPINPIHGHALLKWLSHALAAQGIQAPDPEPEDWGWFVDVQANGATYTIGATSHDEEQPGGPVSWTVQVHKARKLTDRLFGKNKLETNDAVCALIEQAIRSEPRIHEVSTSYDE